eukprot:330102-Chlamydomonas_euryale.AAC.1
MPARRRGGVVTPGQDNPSEPPSAASPGNSVPLSRDSDSPAHTFAGGGAGGTAHASQRIPAVASSAALDRLTGGSVPPRRSVMQRTVSQGALRSTAPEARPSAL